MLRSNKLDAGLLQVIFCAFPFLIINPVKTISVVLNNSLVSMIKTTIGPMVITYQAYLLKTGRKSYITIIKR